MKRVLISLSILCILAAVAAADYIDLPVKWSQPYDPQYRGWLSDCTGTEIQADDFECRDPDPIVAVRWWGVYWGEVDPRDPAYKDFHISFHLSTGQHPDSIPGALIELYDVVAQESFTGDYESSGGFAIYRYDAYLREAFDQWLYSQSPENEIPGELWIDICQPSGEDWCWMESGTYNLDYPAFSFDGHNGPWASASGDPDLAFELMTVPEPATMALLGLGLAGLVMRHRRKK